MDRLARLKELEAKLEREGLTDAEMSEIALIHSLSLEAARQNIELLLKELHNLKK